jgi:hypothetical protein
MYKEVYENLLNIYSCYQQVADLGKQIYSLLKEKKMRDVQPLQVTQMKKLEDLKKAQEAFLTLLPKGHLSDILPTFTEQERTLVNAVVVDIKKIEQQTKDILVQNQYYLQMQITVTESIVDCISEMNAERNHHSQLFMNELL